METRAHVLAKIDAYLACTGMSAWALSYAATSHTRHVARLRDGRDIKLSTIEALELFMLAHPGGVRVPRPGSRKPAATEA